MSNQQHHYSTFQSTSYSSYTDSAGNAYTSATSSNPSGTTIHNTSQRAGQPATMETTKLPGQVTGGGVDNSKGRIEDVTDADRQYEEKMEDEYAKREGGA